MPSERDLQEQLFDFISEELGVKRQRLTLQTSINHDLGCDSTDAEDFMDNFFSRFNVDPSQIIWDDYFAPEIGFTFRDIFTFPFSMLLLIYRSFFNQEQSKVRSKKPLTISYLLNMIIASQHTKKGEI